MTIMIIKDQINMRFCWKAFIMLDIGEIKSLSPFFVFNYYSQRLGIIYVSSNFFIWLLIQPSAVPVSILPAYA